MGKFCPIGLITTDLHLTDKVEDSYRFSIFEWIIEKYAGKIKYIFILGDLTDKKNYHADHLVDRISEAIYRLARHFKIIILRGNHDYDTEPETPFFGFLGKMKNVSYIRHPGVTTIGKGKWIAHVLFLPYSREPGKNWNLKCYNKIDAIFLHQTFRGAKSESGYELGGIGTMPFKRFKCPIFCGDVHAPQQLGPITYVGSPYHVHYGDQFNPRVLLVDKKFNTKDVKFPAPKKLVFDITSAGAMMKRKDEIEAGDLAKIRLHLPPQELGEWPAHRDKIYKMAKKLGLSVSSLTLKELGKDKSTKDNAPTKINKRSRRETFEHYCTRNNIDGDMKTTGEILLSGED